MRGLSSLISSINWKYAVGELILIVSGVTLALAANAWYSAMLDERTEAEYFDRILASLETDVARFLDIEAAMQSKATTLRKLQVSGPDSLLSADPYEVMQQIEYSNWGYLAESDRVTFDELVTTGNLALIDDYEFRDDLGRYYNGYDFARELGQMTRLGSYPEVFVSCLPGDVMFSWLVESEAPDLRDVREGLECISSHPNLLEILNAEINYAARVLSLTRQYRIRAEGLVARINAIR